MAKKTIQEINAGSMADIAFLLLIFFLVTTTMSNDLGIMRKLPPMVDEVPPTVSHRRNALDIRVNRNNQIMVKGELIPISELRSIAKEFVQNPENKDDLPEKEVLDIPQVGKVRATTKHVISLMNDRGTNYKTYIAVQNELTAAYNELRNELAVKTWRTPYEDLDAEKKKAVEKIYPLRVSEAEPIDVASLE